MMHTPFMHLPPAAPHDASQLPVEPSVEASSPPVPVEDELATDDDDDDETLVSPPLPPVVVVSLFVAEHVAPAVAEAIAALSPISQSERRVFSMRSSWSRLRAAITQMS